MKQCYLIFWSVEEKKESKNSKFANKTKANGAVPDTTKLRFMKEQEVSGLLSSLGIKTSLSQISLVGPVYF